MKPSKKEKKRLARKDFEKKRNILKGWQGMARNKMKEGLKYPLMPVQFKKSKKIRGKINKINKINK